MDRTLVRCVCGAADGQLYSHAGLNLLLCHCGTARLDGATDPEEQYRTGEYHRSVSRHEGCQPYADRYTHDLKIASLRWERYRSVLSAERIGAIRTAVDVGCANGAFVDYLVSLGINAVGLEPSPDFASTHVVAGTLAEFFAQGLALPKSDTDSLGSALAIHAANLVTYHDTLEHIIDPGAEIARACRLLSSGGILIVDVPDVWNGAGDHHYKEEHLWYFGRSSLHRMLERAGLAVIAIDQPIPGKLVVYGVHA